MALKLETGEYYQREEVDKGVQAPYDYLCKESCRNYFYSELRQLQNEGKQASFDTVLHMAREGARVIDELDNVELYLRFKIANRAQKEAFKKEAFGRLKDLETYYQEFLSTNDASV